MIIHHDQLGLLFLGCKDGLTYANNPVIHHINRMEKNHLNDRKKHLKISTSVYLNIIERMSLNIIKSYV